MRAWLPLFVRAVRACRLYPANSGMREQHLGVAATSLDRILSEHPSVTLGIRDGAFFCGDEEVFLDDDLRNGPTHFLTGHAIFELSFTSGLHVRELTTLASILAEDPDHRRRLGEDLVTLLWRFQLEHVRHRAVDVLSVAVRSDRRGDRAKSIIDDEETERLRAQQDHLVHLLSVYEEIGRDVVAEIDGQLEPLPAWQQALAGEEARFRSAIAYAERRMSRRYLDAIRLDLASTRSHDHLTARLSDLLLEALRAEPDPSNPGPALPLLVRLFEGMLRDGHFEVARRLIERLRSMATSPTFRGEPELAAHIIAGISGESTVRLCVLALDRLEAAQMTSVLALLRSIDDLGVPFILSGLGLLERADARRNLAGLALELTSHRRPELHRTMRTTRWEVTLELLEQARTLPPHERAELIAIGVAHPHPAVRQEALRGLLGFAPGRPDELLGRSLRDADPAIRSLAVRGLALRKAPVGAKLLGAVIAREDLFNHDPAELRTLLVAWATTFGTAAVPELEKLLGRTSAITSGHRATACEAVAIALSVIDAPQARELLTRGARSLNPRLRGPCKAALEQGGRAELVRLFAPLAELGRGELRNWHPGQSATELLRVLPEWPNITAQRADLIPAAQSSPFTSTTGDLGFAQPAQRSAVPQALPPVPYPTGDLVPGPDELLPPEVYALEQLPSDAILAEEPGMLDASPEVSLGFTATTDWAEQVPRPQLSARDEQGGDDE